MSSIILKPGRKERVINAPAREDLRPVPVQLPTHGNGVGDNRPVRVVDRLNSRSPPRSKAVEQANTPLVQRASLRKVTLSR